MKFYRHGSRDLLTSDHHQSINIRSAVTSKATAIVQVRLEALASKSKA